MPSAPAVWAWRLCSWLASQGVEGFRHRQPWQVDTLRAMGFDDDHIGDSRTCEFRRSSGRAEGAGV